MSDSKNIQAVKSYGNVSDMEKFAKYTDIKNTDGNNLMAKATQKFKKNYNTGTTFIIKFYSK